MKHSVLSFVIFFFSLLSAGAQGITLDQVLQVAMQKNYDVRIIQNTAGLAENDNRYGFGVFIPQVNATGSYLKNTNDSRNVTFSDVETIREGVRSTNTNGSVQLVWALFDGTKMFATRKRIQELAALGEANVRNQMMNTSALVILSYYNITRQKQQLKAIEELMAVSEERVKLAEKKLQVGTGGKPELLQAKVDLNAQRTAKLAQETVIQQLKDQLNGTVGMGLPDVFDVADSIPIRMDLTMEEIATDIESTNRTLLASRKSIDVSKQQLRESRASRSPIINFTSSYNFLKNENEFQATPVSQKYTRNQGYNYGVSVVVPIMNGMNVNRQIGAAKINLERQKLLYDQQLTLAMVGVRNAYIGYDNAKKILQFEEENILLAEENITIALAGFRRGITTFIELRTAQQSLADAYNRLISARYLAKVSETELLRLKGSLLNQ